jgi:pimeloyl-ACP methyl ester carboxylesterase
VDDDRIHRVVSDDGTEIGGRVRGQGPPLVLVPGGFGEGNPDMDFMQPLLVGHFTCYWMSPRGRGVSADSADHSRERGFEDVAAFVEGIGEPVSAFGHSGGAVGVLGGAGRAPAAFRAVALYEPPLPGTGPWASEELLVRLRSAVAEDRLTDAFWTFVDDIIVPTEEERTFFAAPGVAELIAPVMPVLVHEMSEAKRPIDTESLEKLTMPALVIQGTRSADHFKNPVRILSETLALARLVEIAGAGHMGPATHAEAVAGEVVSFFEA